MNDLVSGAAVIQEGRRAMAPATCSLELVIDDPLIVPELLAYEAGAERDGFALTALRIGVLA